METLIERMLDTLGRNSLEAGVLVLVVLLTQRICGARIAARWRCALWLLVMARMLLPVSVGSGVSVFNWMPRPGNPPAPMASAPAPPEIKPVVLPPLLAAPSADSRPVLRREAPPESAPVANDVADSRVSPSPEPPQFVAKPAVPSGGVGWRITWPLVLFATWLAGVLGCGGYVLVSSIRLHRRLAQLAPITDPEMLDSLRDCRRGLGVRGEFALAESPDVTTPALYGLLKPRLLLPSGFSGRFSANELRFILLHELAHVKRRDILCNWLAAGLQIVHWFNPLIWFGFGRWRADRELACDELALEAAGAGHNREYGETILRLLESFTPRAAVPGLLGILEDKRQLRRRLRTIGSFRPGKKLGILSAALFAGLGLVCLTDAQSSKPQTAPEASPAAAPQSQPTPTNEVRRGADPVLTAAVADVPAKTMTITVTDAETGQPIEDAELRASYGDTRTGNQSRPARLTDAQGRYVMRIPLPPESERRGLATFTVSVKHRDYAGRSVDWKAERGNVLETLPGAATIRLERGVTVGGVVRDACGAPLAGVRVLLAGSGFRGFAGHAEESEPEDYPEISGSSKAHPAAMTDARGCWTFAGYPADLETVKLTLIRPDDSQESFSTARGFEGIQPATRISLTDLRATNAVLVLRDGITVHGLVVDESGRPLPSVSIAEGYGHGNIVRVSAFTTDPSGRFTRFHRAPRQWIYTASSEGRATTSVVAQVEPQMPEVRLVMAPAKPLKIRVTDATGNPVAGVGITVVPYRTEAQILDWQAETDAAGLATWSNAPTSRVTFRAVSKAFGERQFKAGPADGEKVVVLSEDGLRETTVEVRAFDAKTGAPVNLESVGAGYNNDFDFKILSRPNAPASRVKIRAADFREGGLPTYTIRLEAGGYEPFVSEYLDLSEGRQNLAVALTPCEPAKGVAFFPNGEPAAGARIWVWPTPESVTGLTSSRPGQYDGDALAKTVVENNGEFTLPVASPDSPVVFTSGPGFLKTTRQAIQRTHEARLQPWGRVAGVLKIAGQPRGGVMVNLRPLLWSPELGLRLFYQVATLPDGRFAFSEVPAGEYQLSRQLTRRVGRLIFDGQGQDHQMPLVVKAGETTRVEYAISGRAVLGRALPNSRELAVDWMNDDHTLTLLQPAISGVNAEDFATRKAFLEARAHSRYSPEQWRLARAARTYALVFARDGSFRVEDVPPGTYELSLRVTQPAAYDRYNPVFIGFGKELGALTREVVVPPGDTPWDLGTLVVAMKDDLKRAAPANLRAHTLDGKPLSLASFKGKYVVLVFWEPGSDRSARQLAQLQKLPPELLQDERLVFLGACVDVDADAVRQAVAARAYPWTQTLVYPADVAAQSFDLSPLPAIYLLDVNGRVIARDLDADDLRPTLDPILGK